MTLEEKLDVAGTLLEQTKSHAEAYADMRTKAGRVLNSRIRGMILSLADQTKAMASELYALHKETEPIKTDDTAAKKQMLLHLLNNINEMEIN